MHLNMLATWHTMLPLSKYFYYLDKLLHPLYMNFLFILLFLSLVVSGEYKKKCHLSTGEKNCVGKSSTICKIEYHINIEFLPNNIHIAHLTSVMGKKRFLDFMCAICLTNDSAAILTATE